MNGAQFKRDMAAMLARAGNKAQAVVRASALELGKGVVEKSPVDTGRFKGNWQYGAGRINASTASAPDSSGTAALSRIAVGVAGFVPGQTIYITNSLPYAQRLEYGWSQQASQGMVRLTVAEFASKIAAIARAA